MSSSATAPRIAPLEPPYEAHIETFLSKWMPPESPMEPLRLFRTLAVHEQLASRMRPQGAAILAHGQVEPRDREIVIHRTCARTGAEYEWGVHAVAYGRAVGLSDKQITATVRGAADDPVWSEHDALLVRLADELHDTCTVSETLWAQLAEGYSEVQLLELLIIAGQYRIISYLVNAVAIEREPWAERFPNAS
jgi:4-carboxymuconolactone decarboxylase